MAKIVCKILGVLFFAIGLIGLVTGEDAHRYHALVHFATGLVALYFGFAGSRSGAKQASFVLGVFYLLGLGILGLVSLGLENPIMNRLWNPGPLDIALRASCLPQCDGAIF